MDKVRIVLAALKKYYFWVVCGIILIVAIVCWWMGTQDLAGQFRQRKTKLESAFKGVLIPQNHPNQGVIDQIHQQHAELKRGVFEAWTVLYREQKKKNPFPPILGEDFKRQFESLKGKEDLKPEYREIYQNFITQHLPSLLKIVDVRRPASDKDESPAGGDRGDTNRPRTEQNPARGMMPGQPKADTSTEEEWVGTVDWNPADYNALQSRLEWQATPSTLEVVLAQEDLWVYEALLRVIKRTNEGSTGYANAVVKQIENISIGRDATKVWKSAEDAVLHISSGAAPGERQAAGAPPSSAGSGHGEEDVRRQLMEDRYVDDKSKPLPYDAEYPYAKHPFAEFKMMPISMNLVMNQRRLPRLLIECANSNMPIAVRRVRILKTSQSALDLGGASAGGGGAGPHASMAQQPSRATVPAPTRGGGSANEKQETGPYDVPVEIQGIIYIYNPPDREKFGTGAASGEKSADAAATDVAGRNASPAASSDAAPTDDAATEKTPVKKEPAEPRGKTPPIENGVKTSPASPDATPEKPVAVPKKPATP
jgi:hypothetical protein